MLILLPLLSGKAHAVALSLPACEQQLCRCPTGPCTTGLSLAVLGGSDGAEGLAFSLR